MTIDDAILYLDPFVCSFDDYEAQRRHVVEHSGAIAKAFREERGISVRKYAAMLKVSPSYLSKVELGKETISPDLAKRMMDLDHSQEDF